DEPTGLPPEPGDNTGAFLGVTDLPAWLRKPTTRLEDPVQVSESRTLNWLTELGKPVEEEESDAAEPIEAGSLIQLPRPNYIRSPGRVAAASLIESLVARPYPEPASAPAPAPLTIWQRIGLERVLYTILALALLVSAIRPELFAALGVASPNEANVATIAELIDQLAEDDTVLLAYEWDAQRISELSFLEQAIRQHLIEQRTGFISVSTDPNGTILSFDLRDALREADYAEGGENYILLGYRPGGELALRNLAQDFRATLRSDFQGSDASLGALATDVETGEPRLTDIEDLAMIVVMADQVSDVQGWMEQVRPRANEVPMLFLLPAEVSPIVQPYMQQQNTFHLTGKGDALSYDELRGVDSGPVAARLLDGQVAFAVIVFLGIIWIGLLVVIISPRKQEQGEV
ncbi:MAG: hypothetical protein HC876_20575, partial [Chloroflexaceae bacterium]|nr:hypothetical protein [Chloroflexaceae bacterium]